VLSAGLLALSLAVSGGAATQDLGRWDVQVIIEAPANWSPDAHLVLELGSDAYEVTGRGIALGAGPLHVRLVDAGACRVLAAFTAERGYAYFIALGNVPSPTVASRPIEQGVDDEPAFDPTRLSGCDEATDVDPLPAPTLFAFAAVLAAAFTASVAMLRASRRP
jgi:hypothetical protein